MEEEDDSNSSYIEVDVNPDSDLLMQNFDLKKTHLWTILYLKNFARYLTSFYRLETKNWQASYKNRKRKTTNYKNKCNKQSVFL